MSRPPRKRKSAPKLKKKVVAHGGIVVTRSARHGETGAWYRGLKIPSPAGLEAEIFIPCETLNDHRALRHLLAKHGYAIPQDRSVCRQLLADLASSTPHARCTLTSRLGWHGDTYVLAHASIGPARDGEIVYIGPAEAEPGHATGGTLQAWRDRVAAPAATSGLAMFAICVALAPVLLRFVEGESGIFHIHGGSGSGKTTATSVAASVWRNGRTGLDTWNATTNAVEELFARRNDGLVCLDEVTLLAPDAQSRRNFLQQVTHRSTQARGRQRSELSQGSVPSAPHRFLAISNGEKSAAFIAADAGGRRMKGEEARFIDIEVPTEATGIFNRLRTCGRPATVESSREVAKSLNEAVVGCYGTADPAFVRSVVDDLEWAQERVDRFVASFMRLLEVPGDGWSRRIALKFALAYAAGRIAITAGILPWSDVAVWLSVRGAYEQGLKELKAHEDPIMTALTRLKGCLSGDGFVDLVRCGTPSVETVGAAKALRYRHGKQVRLLVPSAVFENLADNRTRDALLQRLDADGILVMPRGDTPRRVWQLTPIKEAGKLYYYVFDEGLADYELSSSTVSAS